MAAGFVSEFHKKTVLPKAYTSIVFVGLIIPPSSPRSSSGDLYATDWGSLIFEDGSSISSLINPVKTPAFFKTAISLSVIAMLPYQDGDEGEGVNQARLQLATD